jgi:hypothetical protein
VSTRGSIRCIVEDRSIAALRRRTLVDHVGDLVLAAPDLLHPVKRLLLPELVPGDGGGQLCPATAHAGFSW